MSPPAGTPPWAPAPDPLTATLAQALRAAAEAPRLPDPPFLQNSLLENHWPTVALLAGAGLLAAWWLRRAGQRRRANLAAIACFALAAAVAAVGALVTTEREVVMARTREAVDAAAAADAAALRDLSTETVRVLLPIMQVPDDRERLLEMAQRQLGPDGDFRLRSHRIGTVRAVIDGPNVARSHVAVRVEPARDGGFGPIGTAWELSWRREPLPGGGFGPWRVTTVRALQLGPTLKGVQP